MNFDSLTDEEYRKICNSIPHKMITKYFKDNSKGFAEISPGFRPNKITHERAVKLLIKFRHHRFISLFIEKTVGACIKVILEEATNYQKEGKSEKLSYINALSHSPFSDNASAFFKLAEKDFSGDNEDLACEIIVLLRDHKMKLSVFEEKVNKLSQELESYKTNNQSILHEFSVNMKELGYELDQLHNKIGELQESKQKTELLYKTLKDNLAECKNDNLRLIKQNDLLNKRMTSFENALKGLVDEKNELATSVRKIVEEGYSKKEKSETCEMSAVKPMRPKNMEEFKDSLEDNFTSIQVTQPTKYLLLSYISDILFCGKPIICHAIISRTLVGCIANALMGTTEVSRLIFSSAVDENVLREFLENSGRIVVLSNFLGNYDNESILMSLISEYKNKIIFLTHSNSKTLTYLSDDMFSYCHYVGLTKTGRFSSDVLPDSDSYKIEEEEYDVEPKYCESRFETILRDILKELHYNDEVINCKAVGIDSEQRLYERLAFDIVPYCLDVLSVNPLNYSQTLQEVIKRNNEYAKLLKEWLG